MLLPTYVVLLGLIGTLVFVRWIFGAPERCPRCRAWFARILQARSLESHDRVDVPVSTKPGARTVTRDSRTYRERFRCRFCRHEWEETSPSFSERSTGTFTETTSTGSWATLAGHLRVTRRKAGAVAALVIATLVLAPGLLTDPPDRIPKHLGTLLSPLKSLLDGSRYAPRRTRLVVTAATWTVWRVTERRNLIRKAGEWEFGGSECVGSGTFQPPSSPLIPVLAEAAPDATERKRLQADFRVEFLEPGTERRFRIDHLVQAKPGSFAGFATLPLTESAYRRLASPSSQWEGEVHENRHGSWFLVLDGVP
ncbi:MAG: hypothetical protein GX442_20825 [Candidatus Riflebacteria bacterium]|nr:hypothetical protein [Candidatus Riflebacteria bacterium]